MKILYLVGGPMGVGKTTTCQYMKEKLNNAVFLDGDWCWDSSPFQVTDETKEMVIRNIVFLLNSFIHCSAYDTILFCWVMHQQSIIDSIVTQLDLSSCELRSISLVCTPAALEERLKKDIAAGLRDESSLSRSRERLPLYHLLNTEKIDVGGLTTEQVFEAILNPDKLT